MLPLRLPFAIAFIVGAGALAAPEPPPPPLPNQLQLLRGHTEAVYSIAFSPDGKLVVTGGFDKAARLFDPATGKELREYSGTQGHKALVLAVGFSPDGTSVATGGSDNTAKIWDVPVGTPTKDYLQGGGVTAVSLSPDGKTFAASSLDGTVKLVAAADGKQLFNLTGHAGPVTNVQFSPNGQLLVSSGADGTLRYWNPADGKAVATVGAHPGAVNAVSVHPNGTASYSVGDDGTLRFWQLPPLPSRNLPTHLDAVNAMTLSNDGNLAITGANDKSVRVSNVTNGQPVKDFVGATTPVQSVALLPNNTVAVAGTSDGRVLFWQAADGKLVANVPAHAGAVTGIAYRPDGAQFASAGADGTVKIWAPPLAGKSFPMPDRVLSASLRPDGRLVTGSADKVVRVWKTADGQMERQFPGHTGEVTAVASTPNFDTVISGSADESIRFWNAANGQLVGTVAGHAGPVTGLTVAPQGNAFASVGQDGAVKMWTLPFVAPKAFAHPDAIVSMSASNDGNRFLTIGNDKQARLWNVANPQPERAFAAAGQVITAASIAADNTTVAVTAADKSLSVWTAGVEKKYSPLAVPATSVGFTADGKYVAAGLGDNSVRLIQTADQKEFKKLDGHTSPAVAMVVTPTLLLTAGADKTVRMWNPADGAAKGQINAQNPVAVMAVSKDNLRVAVGGAAKVVEVFTLADQKASGAPITTPSEVRGISFSPDGTRIAVAGIDNKVRVYGADGKLQEAFAHDGPAVGVAFLPDGKRLVTASADKSARLWNTSFVGQGFHAGPVRQAAFTPQGDRVWTVSDDKTLRVWEAKSGKELKSIPVGDAPVTAFGISADGAKGVTADKVAKVWDLNAGTALPPIALPGVATAAAISGDAKRIAVACTEGAVQKVRAYDAATGKELTGVTETPGVVRSLAFLPDQRTLVVAGDDKVLSLIDVPVQAVLPGHVGGVTAMSYHVSGGQLLTAGKDKAARLWDLGGMKEAKAFGPFAEPVSAATFSKDGALISYALGKVVKVVNPADGKELATLTHPAEVVSIGFNADKSRVVTGATDNLARVWEVATSKELQSFGHGAAVRSVAFLPNNTSIIAASADKTTAVHNLTIQRLVVASPMPLRTVQITSNGVSVLTGGDDKSVKSWNTGNGVVEREFPGATAAVNAVAVSKDVQLVATGGADKTIRTYTFADGKLIAPITSAGGVTGLAFNAKRETLAVAADDKSVTAYNVVYQPGQPTPPEFGRQVQAFAHADAAKSVAFTEAGALYSGGTDKFVKSWRIAGDVPTKNFAHPNLVDAVAFDVKGEQLATGCHDGNVRIFDIAKAAQLKEIKAHVAPTPQPVYAVVWSADGKQVLSCGYDGTMKLWDAASGNLVREFKKYDEKAFPKGHQEAIFSAAFSPDGQFVASGSSDKTVKLWKVADATVVREFGNPNLKQLPAPQPPFAHPGWVYGVKFTPDGQFLITAGSAPKQQGYLAGWRVGDGQLVTGTELASGPIYGLAIDKDGLRVGIACGPRDRLQSAGDGVILKTPGK